MCNLKITRKFSKREKRNCHLLLRNQNIAYISHVHFLNLYAYWKLSNNFNEHRLGLYNLLITKLNLLSECQMSAKEETFRNTENEKVEPYFIYTFDYILLNARKGIDLKKLSIFRSSITEFNQTAAF